MKHIARWLAACMLCGAATFALAQAQPPAVPESLTPEQADALLGSLTDAQVRQLLGRELREKAERQAAAQRTDEGLGGLLLRMRLGLEGMGDGLRARAAVVREGWPLVSGSVATSMDTIAGGRGYPGFRRQVAVLALLIAAGVVVMLLVRRRVFGGHAAVSAPADFPGRLGAAGSRFLLELLPFAAFTLVTLGLAALLFEPGGADRTFHATYATCAAIVVGAAMLSQFLLSPKAPALRLLPLEDRTARFLHRSFLWVTGVGVFAWLTAGLLIRTGVPLKARLVIELITGAAVGLTVLVVILLGRRMVAEAIRGVPGTAGATRLRARLADTWHWFAIAYLALIWAFWASSMLDQGPSTVWAAIASVAMVLLFPLADRWIGRGIDDMLAGSDYALVLRRVMRVLLAVVLFAVVNELWGFNSFGEAQVRLRQAVLASSLDLIAALALALIGWQLIKVGIDRKLAAREVGGVLVEPSQRTRTLLPLLRNFVVVVLIVMTAMLLLSGLGVNIGPLLAGAGVVGLAIGFGAQTLVKDILTGVFFLVDDAFRVGEYIVSGSYKGTVEAITLRSLKLRHHRGALYTVPFGELKAVQNLSRDWVIDKMTLGITYDSDLDKARKLIKKIGQELAQDPELAPGILETLKMQGVEEFGDFAIQVRLKFMTKPGSQFAVRRRAYAMIKKAFEANGIKFAFPTVQVAGGGDPVAAAARQVLAASEGKGS